MRRANLIGNRLIIDRTILYMYVRAEGDTCSPILGTTTLENHIICGRIVYGILDCWHYRLPCIWERIVMVFQIVDTISLWKNEEEYFK